MKFGMGSVELLIAHNLLLKARSVSSVRKDTSSGVKDSANLVNTIKFNGHSAKSVVMAIESLEDFVGAEIVKTLTNKDSFVKNVFLALNLLFL